MVLRTFSFPLIKVSYPKNVAFRIAAAKLQRFFDVAKNITRYF